VKKRKSAMPMFQENQTQQSQKPAIIQELKATDGHKSPAEAIIAKTTTITANLFSNISSPRTEAEEQKDQDKVGKMTMSTVDDVTLVPDRETGAVAEAEGAIDPPPGRPRN
jgi:hypothetical protein